jgi:hypothetical protein
VKGSTHTWTTDKPLEQSKTEAAKKLREEGPVS